MWIRNIQRPKKKGYFTLTWYKNHIITKELLKNDVLHGVVLDIGCGLGTRAFLASKHCKVVGIDFSRIAIGYATKHFNSHFCVADILRMPFRDQTFDNAFMLAVIEHVKDLRTLISEIRRVLRPFGKLFISVTDRDYHGDPSHVHIFTKNSLLAVFKPCTILQSYIKGHIIFATIQF